ncbi:hypothetical protein LXL04_001767 [Taraxacum kok-saghyz]
MIKFDENIEVTRCRLRQARRKQEKRKEEKKKRVLLAVAKTTQENAKEGNAALGAVCASRQRRSCGHIGRVVDNGYPHRHADLSRVGSGNRVVMCERKWEVAGRRVRRVVSEEHGR